MSVGTALISCFVAPSSSRPRGAAAKKGSGRRRPPPALRLRKLGAVFGRGIPLSGNTRSIHPSGGETGSDSLLGRAPAGSARRRDRRRAGRRAAFSTRRHGWWHDGAGEAPLE